jgi:hypothetical protein
MVSLTKSIDSNLSYYSRSLVNEFNKVNKTTKSHVFKNKILKSISHNNDYKTIFLQRIISHYNKAKDFVDKNVVHLFSNPKKDIYSPFKIESISILDNGVPNSKITAINNKNPMPDYIESRFSSKRFSTLAMNECVVSISVKFKICNTNIDVCFHCLAKDFSLKSQRSKLHKRIKRILTRISFVILFFQESSCSKTENLNMNLFLFNLKKKLPKMRDTTLDTENVNSGFTTFYHSGNKNIVIFRDEEMDKLIIHELIHFYYLDFHLLDINLADFLNVSNSIEFIPNESYTETITILIHCELLALEIQGNNISTSKIMDLAMELLAREILFGLFQCAKILYHYNYHHIDNFILNNINNIHQAYTNNFRQTSCLLSYFFIKTSLLANFNQLINFLKENFISSINLKISDSEETKTKYKLLIKNSLENLEYQQQIQVYLNFIATNVVSEKKRKSIKKSCRKLNHSKCVNNKLKSIKYSETKFATGLLFNNQRMSLTEL